ncbi:unnamed protein product [Boreogadus saida]
MGLFLDPLASVNEARGLHGTATTPSNGIQGSFICKDYHLVSAKSGLRIWSQSQSSTSPPGDCNQTNGVEERVSVGDEVRVFCTVSKGKRIRAARPVAQYSANTPRHDSSTSDFMKLQTMGGPPEELRNGLLDDTRRQSSRTNSTRVVASMVPV